MSPKQHTFFWFFYIVFAAAFGLDQLIKYSHATLSFVSVIPWIAACSTMICQTVYLISIITYWTIYPSHKKLLAWMILQWVATALFIIQSISNRSFYLIPALGLTLIISLINGRHIVRSFNFMER